MMGSQRSDAAPKTVLITGAAGNLGCKLHAHLAGRYALRLLDRVADPARGIHAGDLGLLTPDWTALLQGVDVVVHLAANPSPSAPWDRLIGPNIDGLLNLYLVAAQAGVGRIVLASSVWVLNGHRARGGPLDAETPPDPGRNAYGATKLFAERVGKAFFETHGMTTVALRLGACRRDENTSETISGESRWEQDCWLSDGDMCRGVEAAIAAEVPGFAVVALRSANPRSRWDLSAAARLGYRPQDEHVTRLARRERLKAALGFVVSRRASVPP